MLSPGSLLYHPTRHVLYHHHWPQIWFPVGPERGGQRRWWCRWPETIVSKTQSKRSRPPQGPATEPAILLHLPAGLRVPVHHLLRWVSQSFLSCQLVTHSLRFLSGFYADIHPVIDTLATSLGYQNKQYVVVIDAGSTGSRVLAYEFHKAIYRE